jgi:hypothetical protein
MALARLRTFDLDATTERDGAVGAGRSRRDGRFSITSMTWETRHGITDQGRIWVQVGVAASVDLKTESLVHPPQSAHSLAVDLPGERPDVRPKTDRD